MSESPNKNGVSFSSNHDFGTWEWDTIDVEKLCAEAAKSALEGIAEDCCLDLETDDDEGGGLILTFRALDYQIEFKRPFLAAIEDFLELHRIDTFEGGVQVDAQDAEPLLRGLDAAREMIVKAIR